MMAKSKDVGPAMDREWEIEEDIRTLLRAAEIRNDKARFARAKEHAKKKADEMRKISGTTNS